jgi:hypothetical protein
MKRLKILFVISTIAFSCGCTTNTWPNGPIDGAGFTKNFIQTYTIPSDLALRFYAGKYIEIIFEGEDLHNIGPRERTAYDDLAEKYMDLSYNRRTVHFSTRAIGKEYSRIDIICNKRFDESHDAGESLNDIVKICANSFRNYIKSNYDDSFKSPDLPREFFGLYLYRSQGHYPIFKFLDQVTKEDLILIETTVYLYFTSKPVAGEYEFTITISSDEEPLSKTLTVNFK